MPTQEFSNDARPIHAAVARRANGAFSVESLELDAPRRDEILVRVVATGVCHTDASVRSGEVPSPLPIVLGHEGAGIVEAVGTDVTKVVRGDHVVMTFNSCGVCEGCQTGHPSACDAIFPCNFAGCRADRSHAVHSPEGEQINDRFFGQSSFATFAICTERNVVKVRKEVPLKILGPLGCGIQTGAGSVLNALKIGPGNSFAIFGTGAVGMSALMAAKAVGASMIIAVDVVPSRLSLARELGATHSFNPRECDSLAEIQRASGGGVQFALDTTGNVSVIRTAVDALAPRGVCGILGATAPGMDIAINASAFMSYSKTLKGIVAGDSIPDFFIPKLIDLYLSGRFPFDRLLRFYDLREIDRAFDDSKNGATIKPVVVMPGSPEFPGK